MSASASSVVSLLVRKPSPEPLIPKPLTQPLMVPTNYREYMLVREWDYVWRDDRLRHKLTIPCGFQNNGASVPRLAWTLTGITPDGLIRGAALVHDWLYELEGDPALYFQAEPNSDEWQRVRRRFTRLEADQLFYQIMREAGVGKLQAWIAYRGVRFGGWWSW